jgi:sirohydrochlorin ferrochelatase
MEQYTADTSDTNVVVAQHHHAAGYLLVLHGSHDQRYQRAIGQLSRSLSQTLATQAQYQIAFLECSATSLHQQIQTFAQQLARQRIPQMQILPLFLLPGVHVMEDIPAEVAQAQIDLERQGCPVEIVVQPYLGSHIGTGQSATHPTSLRTQLVACFAPVAPTATRILVAHGTRRSGGNQPLEELAQAVQAVPAYSFVPPSLVERVTELYDRGVREVVILPYTLLAGALTDGINRQILGLSEQFPAMQMTQLPTLAESGVLLDLILAWACVSHSVGGKDV